MGPSPVPQGGRSTASRDAANVDFCRQAGSYRCSTRDRLLGNLLVRGGDMTTKTRAQIAQELHISERTLRRLMAQHGIEVIRAGRKVLFDATDERRLREALRCPSTSENEATCGTRVARSALAPRRCTSANSAQDAIRELMRKRSPASAKPTNAPHSFTVRQGGRDVSL